MGTRCLTEFVDGEGRIIATMYRQFDGYPAGHGEDLKNFLRGKKIVNGFSPDTTLDTAFNGMECLTAAVVAHFKEGIGNIYLYPAGIRDVDEEYIYVIDCRAAGRTDRDESGKGGYPRIKTIDVATGEVEWWTTKEGAGKTPCSCCGKVHDPKFSK